MVKREDAFCCQSILICPNLGETENEGEGEKFTQAPILHRDWGTASQTHPRPRVSRAARFTCVSPVAVAPSQRGGDKGQRGAARWLLGEQLGLAALSF